MPSLDNVYDFVERMQKDKFDFVLMLNQSGDTSDLSDLFIRISNVNSFQVLYEQICDLKTNLEHLQFDEEGNLLNEEILGSDATNDDDDDDGDDGFLK
jgi:hypothetical protein